MSSSAEQSSQRCIEAYEALAAAETYGAARAAWEDFLTYWRRGLNRCDVMGQRSRGSAHVACYKRVIIQPALAYLWAARNAEEHGVVEIAARQERAIVMGVLGGYREERGAPGPNGELTFTYTPLTDDPPPFLAVMPEHIKLRPIAERGGVTPVPAAFDYDLGMTSAPVALAKMGLDFLLQEIADLAQTDG